MSLGRRCAHLLGLVGVALAPLAVACEPELGEVPAKCSDGRCPEGYDCIHGVCALPGTSVPITVVRTDGLRGGDLQVIAQSTSALIVWQTYSYGPDGQGFVARRLFADGSVSAELTLVSDFAADEGGVEPFFDLLRLDEQRLLLAITAGPLDDDPRPRVAVYHAELPREGDESATPSGDDLGTSWGPEARVSTIGYGAVSRPELVRTADDRIELGYLMSLPADTSAALGVFELSDSGEAIGVPPSCTPLSPCPPARTTEAGGPALPVAVGVHDALATPGRVYWVLDDVRPTVLPLSDMGPLPEITLGPLGIPLAADGAGVVFLQPSQRTGDGLPTGPVIGAATIGRAERTSAGAATMTQALYSIEDGIRDTPRPAWVPRSGRPGLLVTPGPELNAPKLRVLAVDTTTGEATQVAEVERMSSLEIAAVQAVVVDGKLFVVWLDEGPDHATVRAAVLDEP